jgi:hypothetical protein
MGNGNCSGGNGLRDLVFVIVVYHSKIPLFANTLHLFCSCETVAVAWDDIPDIERAVKNFVFCSCSYVSTVDDNAHSNYLLLAESIPFFRAIQSWLRRLLVLAVVKSILWNHLSSWRSAESIDRWFQSKNRPLECWVWSHWMLISLKISISLSLRTLNVLAESRTFICNKTPELRFALEQRPDNCKSEKVFMLSRDVQTKPNVRKCPGTWSQCATKLWGGEFALEFGNDSRICNADGGRAASMV